MAAWVTRVTRRVARWRARPGAEDRPAYQGRGVICIGVKTTTPTSLGHFLGAQSRKVQEDTSPSVASRDQDRDQGTGPSCCPDVEKMGLNSGGGSTGPKAPESSSSRAAAGAEALGPTGCWFGPVLEVMAFLSRAREHLLQKAPRTTWPRRSPLKTKVWPLSCLIKTKLSFPGGRVTIRRRAAAGQRRRGSWKTPANVASDPTFGRQEARVNFSSPLTTAC